MASGTITPVQAPPAPPRPVDQVEQYIEGRLRHTQRQLQRIDLGTGLVTLLCGGLVLLLAAALADHWLVFGGLGFRGRMLFWLAIVGAGGLYAWRRIVPPLARRISPIYAAHTIERSRPTLKNSLINFLLFRRERQVVPEVVFHALEDRAARDISAVPSEAGVDAAPVIHRGYLLAAALAVFGLYLVLSPKSPLTSAARVLLPWAKIAPPTRVTIDDIKPGEDVERFHGDGVEVSATVKGIRDGEPILLYYTTADGQVINQAIPLTAAAQEKAPPNQTATAPACRRAASACNKIAPIASSPATARATRSALPCSSRRRSPSRSSIINIPPTPRFPAAPSSARATSAPSTARKSPCTPRPTTTSSGPRSI